MRTFAGLFIVAALVTTAGANMIEDFESGFAPAWSEVGGQNGWIGATGGQWANTGTLPYSINNNSMYTYGSAVSVGKPYSAAGITSLNDGDILSLLYMPVEGNWSGVLGGHSITASTSVGAGAGTTVVVKNNGSNEGEFFAYVDSGEIALNLPLVGGTSSDIYRFEFEMDFTGSSVTFYGENITDGSGRVADGPHAYTWGTAIDVAALGGVMLGGGNYMIDDIILTPIPEPAMLSLLLCGGLAMLLRRK